MWAVTRNPPPLQDYIEPRFLFLKLCTYLNIFLIGPAGTYFITQSDSLKYLKVVSLRENKITLFRGQLLYCIPFLASLRNKGSVEEISKINKDFTASGPLGKINFL